MPDQAIQLHATGRLSLWDHAFTLLFVHMVEEDGVVLAIISQFFLRLQL